MKWNETSCKCHNHESEPQPSMEGTGVDAHQTFDWHAATIDRFVCLKLVLDQGRKATCSFLINPPLWGLSFSEISEIKIEKEWRKSLITAVAFLSGSYRDNKWTLCLSEASLKFYPAT